MNSGVNGLGSILLQFDGDKKELSHSEKEHFFSFFSSMFSDSDPIEKGGISNEVSLVLGQKNTDFGRLFSAFTSKCNNIAFIENLNLNNLTSCLNPKIQAILDATLKQVDTAKLNGKSFRPLINELLIGLPADLVDALNNWLDVLNIDNINDPIILTKLLVFILVIIIMILMMYIEMMEKMMEISAEAQSNL